MKKNREWMGDLLWISVICFLALGVVMDMMRKCHASEMPDGFNSWQLVMLPSGAPKLRYVDAETMTAIGFTFINSKDCSDVKLVIRKFYEQDTRVMAGKPFRGVFIIDNEKFRFAAEIPTPKDIGPLTEFTAIWAPSEQFFDALVGAKEIHWKDSTQGVTDLTYIDLDGFTLALNIMMEICYNEYIRVFPPNGIHITNPTEVSISR